jgi:hypothetical protein
MSLAVQRKFIYNVYSSKIVIRLFLTRSCHSLSFLIVLAINICMLLIFHWQRCSYININGYLIESNCYIICFSSDLVFLKNLLSLWNFIKFGYLWISKKCTTNNLWRKYICFPYPFNKCCFCHGFENGILLFLKNIL